MKKVLGGVTRAKGYKAASAEAGIKYEGREDMALVYSEVPAAIAGVFTKNVVKAAPVLWDMNIVKNEECAQAIVLNSGIANACTGEEGKKANMVMASSVAKELNIEEKLVLTASTGVIGMQLPLDKLEAGGKKLVANLGSDLISGEHAARAIMTTDTERKEYCVTFNISGKEVTLGAMCKGSGMIHPNMATMLCVATTDLAISKELLQEALSENVKTTFNMISVDRDTSTNDTYVVFANGMAGNKKITEKNDDYYTFCEALQVVARSLAIEMAKDGEGATKLIEASVMGAKNWDEAAALAKSVITSNLVKTAIFGKDANWGRIMCALGYAGVEFDPEKIDLYLEGDAASLPIVVNGKQTIYKYVEERAEEIFESERIRIVVDMKQGNVSARAWGCDFSYDYVKINGDYRS